MPRTLVVDPSNVRSASFITTPDIPVNQYKPNFAAELETHGKDGLVDILHDMIVIRAVRDHAQRDQDHGRLERASSTTTAARRTSPSARRPPPSARPAQLGVDDFIFGSHRSHGEILAKGLSAIAQARPSRRSRTIMKGFLGGETLARRREGRPRRPAGPGR